jgi:hypothetical protein
MTHVRRSGRGRSITAAQKQNRLLQNTVRFLTSGCSHSHQGWNCCYLSRPSMRMSPHTLHSNVCFSARSSIEGGGHGRNRTGVHGFAVHGLVLFSLKNWLCGHVWVTSIKQAAI